MNTHKNKIQTILSDADISYKEIYVFKYGSRIYGTESHNSDYDYIVVLKPDNRCGTEFRQNDLNFTIYGFNHFQSNLSQHKIHALECWFSDTNCQKQFKFQLNKRKLREEIAAKASHSFVKAKKKVEIEKDYYIGWKSLFHSLRILKFGIQIANEGKIYDFTEANDYWFQLKNNPSYIWEDIKHQYKPIFNELRSNLRSSCKKDNYE